MVAKETASRMLCWSAKVLRVCECVCVISGLPGQLMEWARARGHYVEAVRALETLPSISLCFSLSLPFFPSHPSLQTRPGSQRHFNDGNENRAGRVEVRHMRGGKEREHTCRQSTYLSKSQKNKEALSTSYTHTHTHKRV